MWTKVMVLRHKLKPLKAFHNSAHLFGSHAIFHKRNMPHTTVNKLEKYRADPWLESKENIWYCNSLRFLRLCVKQGKLLFFLKKAFLEMFILWMFDVYLPNICFPDFQSKIQLYPISLGRSCCGKPSLGIFLVTVIWLSNGHKNLAGPSTINFKTLWKVTRKEFHCFLLVF